MTTPPPVPPQPHPTTAAAMDDAAIDAVEEADADGTATETISPDAVRKLANAHFARGDYGTALPLYSLAIDGCRGRTAGGSGGQDAGDDSATEEEAGEGGEPPSPLVVHLCNRSACLYRMERYDEALGDAAEAVRLATAAAAAASEGNANDDAGDGGGHHAKASFRLARTQIQLGAGEDAVRTVRAALERLDRLQQEEQPRRINAHGGAGNSKTKSANGNTGGDGINDTDGAEPVLTTDDDEEVARGNTLEVQRAELERLLRHAERVALAGRRKKSKTGGGTAAAAALPPPQDLTVEPRTPSIREFTLDAEIGQGNFSRVVVCTHRVTHQRFALKIIEKKKVEQLAKRQHPNVYNEVRMERRVLEDRLPPPPASATTDNNAITDNANASNDPRRRHIVTLHHSFQDYGSLYFLQELHDANGDLWSALRAGSKMVGTHRGLARRYAWELLGAVEYLHARGIVHRDLKPEVSYLVC